MGKVEKVIVLSVLFLVALILVVTVTVDDPLDKAKVVEAGGKQAAPVVAQAPTAPPTSAQPLLSSNVAANQPMTPATQTQAPVTPPASQPAAVQHNAAQQPAAAPAATLPPGALLKKTEGLQDSWFSDLKLYTWKEGDTWRGLAHTYYGDWQRLDVLKRHNEGRMNVAPGETVFIPVFADERGQAAEAARLAAANNANGAAAGATAGAPTQLAATDSKAPAASLAATPNGDAKSGGKKLHVVLNGESLWKIAKAELGDGNRWKEIYEANRDVLDKPESIRKGMRLRIP